MPIFWAMGRYPEKQKILPHVGMLRFYSPQNQTDVVKSGMNLFQENILK